MQAIVMREHGGPEVLRIEEVDDPWPGPDQILVDVLAAGVNFADIYAREGRPPYVTDVLTTPGSEGAGRVRALGESVTDIAPGDIVAWTGVPAGYAERVAIPADRAVPVPAGVGPEVAAATMLQGCTAHYLATSTWPVRSGHVVVVHAAAGGVGLLLTQLAVHRGGTVIATTSTEEKAGLAREAGAAHVAGYDDYLGVVRDVTSGRGADAVYDGVGAATFDDSLRALRRRGMLVLYGGASGPVPPLEVQRLAVGGSLFLTRPTLADYITTREELTSRTDELFAGIAAGWLRVRIGGRYPLADASRAHEDLAARRTTGKLLLLP